jgi:hypothetical protein
MEVSVHVFPQCKLPILFPHLSHSSLQRLPPDLQDILQVVFSRCPFYWKPEVVPAIRGGKEQYIPDSEPILIAQSSHHQSHSTYSKTHPETNNPLHFHHIPIKCLHHTYIILQDPHYFFPFFFVLGTCGRDFGFFPPFCFGRTYLLLLVFACVLALVSSAYRVLPCALGFPSALRGRLGPQPIVMVEEGCMALVAVEGGRVVPRNGRMGGVFQSAPFASARCFW